MNKWRNGERWTGNSRLSKRFRWGQRGGHRCDQLLSLLPANCPSGGQLEGKWMELETLEDSPWAHAHTKIHTSVLTLSSYNNQSPQAHTHTYRHTLLQTQTESALKAEFGIQLIFCHFLSLFKSYFRSSSVIAHHYGIIVSVVSENDSNSWLFCLMVNRIGFC